MKANYTDIINELKKLRDQHNDSARADALFAIENESSFETYKNSALKWRARASAVNTCISIVECALGKL